MMLRSALAALLVLLAAAAGARAQTAAAPPRPAGPPVILISIDGFRADYLTRGYTPTLLRLARKGAWAAEGMRPSFPSLTFPNHYTLVTGLRPDHHGVVANTMNDPAVTGDEHFAVSDFKAVSDGRWWSGAVPLWVEAQKAGLRSATLFWPGSEAAIGGVRPTRWAHFDDALSPDTRVDMLLDWLDLPPDKRPTFLTLYFDTVDEAGHHHGPDSPEVNRAAAQVDRAIARLLRGLAARKRLATANLVIVADHGMTQVSKERLAFVDDWTPEAGFTSVGGGSSIGLTPADAQAEAAILKPHDHVQCWRKADIPARLHYGTHPRIPPIVCLADLGWYVTTHGFAARLRSFDPGQHGYDPEAKDMRALFIGSGPAFKGGDRLPPFDNVDVRPILEGLLGLPVTDFDGDGAALEALSQPLAPPALWHDGRRHPGVDPAHP